MVVEVDRVVVEVDRVVVLASLVVALASLVVVEVERVVAAGRVAVEVGRASSGRRFPAHPLRWIGRCQNAFLEAFSWFISVSRRRRSGAFALLSIVCPLPVSPEFVIVPSCVGSASWLVRIFRRDIYWLQPLLISASCGWTGWLQNAFLEALSLFLSVSRRRRTGRCQNAFLEYSLPNAFNGALRSTSWLVRSFRRDIYIGCSPC